MLESLIKYCKSAIIIDKTRNYVHLLHVLWYIDSKLPEARRQDLEQLLHNNLPKKDSEGFMRTIAQAYIEEGIEKAIIQGRGEGIEKGKIETAKYLIKLGVDIEFISEVTGLRKQKIKSYS